MQIKKYVFFTLFIQAHFTAPSPVRVHMKPVNPVNSLIHQAMHSMQCIAPTTKVNKELPIPHAYTQLLDLCPVNQSNERLIAVQAAHIILQIPIDHYVTCLENAQQLTDPKSDEYRELEKVKMHYNHLSNKTTDLLLIAHNGRRTYYMCQEVIQAYNTRKTMDS